MNCKEGKTLLYIKNPRVIKKQIGFSELIKRQQ